MDFWIKAAQLLLSLSILVVLHEFGHFFFAKLFKTRVEKFYLFFDAGFSLFKMKRGETEYGIGWLPLGGYVKISGMIDESMDKEQMAKPPEEWEFRAKPTWQRLLIMIGGVSVNLILGFVIYMGIMFAWGDDQLPMENVKWGVHCDSLMYELGFEEGDHILTLNGEAPEDFMVVNKMLLLNDITNVEVERGGQKMSFDLPDEFGQMMIDSALRRPFQLRYPAVIALIVEDKPAQKAGLLVGDSIVSVNGISSVFFFDVAKQIQGNAGKTVDFGFYRDNQLKTASVDITEEGEIGFSANALNYMDIKHTDYSFGESIPKGFELAKETLTDYVVSMKFLFSKSGASQIGGFGTIGGLFAPTWDWEIFWSRTAFLSLILAFMNILPIPALDGGHVMFLIYEMVVGKAPGQKFMEYAQMGGMILLLGLLLYANGNDLYRAIFGG